MMTNPVVHFEMPADDRQRMADFYTKAFGWKADLLGPEFGNYVTVQTTETGEDGIPTKPGINGGFFEKTKDNQYPSVVIGVKDIRAAMKNVEDAGGKVLGGSYKPGEPDDIPGIGLYVSFLDSEGNRVGMIQPAPMPSK
jgi:predicted enzyme related to lactoylglutathione lyase